MRRRLHVDALSACDGHAALVPFVVMRGGGLVEEIVWLLESSKRPLRASEIAQTLRTPRSRVNAILHANRGSRFAKNDDDFTWIVAARGSEVLAAQSPRRSELRVEAFFAPDDRPLEALRTLLDGARQEILVQAYYLKSAQVADALHRAHERGVRVRVLLGCTSTNARISRDSEVRHGGRKHAIASRLDDAGIDVFEDHGDTNNHNKCAVIDRRVTVTGGLNFCDHAADNADNMVVIHSREIAEQFRNDWTANFRHAERFQADD